MSLNSKKIVIPVLLMVMTLVILVMGATYAYFMVDINNSVSTVKVTTIAESVGIVSLAPENNLELNLSTADMMKGDNDITYYATIDGTPVTSENELSIAKASVEGNGVMQCDYEMTASITGTNNMYLAFQNMNGRSDNQLVLNVDGIDYDLNTTTFPKTIAGTITGLEDDVDKYIMASFRLVNKSNIDQTDLSGTDLQITFKIDKFECDIVG